MTEDLLYDKNGLFHNIVKQSKIMGGRYEVLPNGSKDLDAGNLLTGIELPQTKYPLVACLPPMSMIKPTLREGQWEWFTMRLLFLCISGSTGDGQIKQRDPLTNTSMHRVSLDWSDMKQCAFNFMYALEWTVDRLRNQVLLDDKNLWRINRVSNAQRDKVNGVIIQFSIAIAWTCEVSTIDYPAGAISLIELPGAAHNPHMH